MLPLLSLVGFTLLLLLVVYRFVIYPTFLSPLSKIPKAHFTASILPFWLKWKQRNGATGIHAIFEAHRKCGPVVQISPNEVSVASLDGLRQIYTGGFEKPEHFAEFMNYGTPNLVSMLDYKSHSTQKRMISHVYSKSYVLNSKDVQTLSSVLLFDRLLPCLQSVASSSTPLEVHALNEALGMDFTSAYLFGLANSTDFIRDIRTRREYMNNIRTKMRGLYGSLAATKEQRMKATQEVEAFVLSLCQAAERSQVPDEKSPTSTPNTQPVVYSELSSHLCKSSSESDKSHLKATASEMLDHLLATHETFRVTLTYIQWELSRRPSLQSSLRAELLTLSPSFHPTNSQSPHPLPHPQDLSNLPLLDAIVKETLRLYPPTPALSMRVVPPSGTVIDGYSIPGGVEIGTSAYCLHRNPSVFPEPESWLPERWLAASRPPQMNSWFWAFGSGGRMCIGSHFAMHALKAITATTYTHFETTIVDDDGIEQEDTVLAGPKGEKLVLSYRAVADS
ncbi:hypothetical protein M430DRAFT_124452 [Amorphotheca resinae ATCC 22711]|uniref:Cytochrome P450 monooxygenase n=1 Tax=Amorphotheca resinae ATCC 22711 TaxID=857342 RepID=A0A2T3AVX0_AMORE|nr:hypothetical protein M430DRAFT_124452 [Amorphotheca resinae ATCC 22711]PSS12811.1 hypothetical protein M430DRAFT_124452 [Amorphotheca resinae ATCC 22711]